MDYFVIMRMDMDFTHSYDYKYYTKYYRNVFVYL